MAFFEKGRNEKGGDIREGKPSILVLRHLEIFPDERDHLWQILSKPRMQTTKEDVAILSDRFREGGALDAALNDIKKYRDRLSHASIVNRYPVIKRILHILIARILKPIEFLL